MFRVIQLSLLLLTAWPTSAVLGLQLGPSGADQEKVITTSRIENSIVVDGILDEPEWNLAQPVMDFIQRDPRTGEPATERTEVRLLYDDQNLYLGVYCFDSAGSKGIVVNDIRRDFDPRDSDGFVIILDTFDDDRNGFMFNFNALGAKFDMQAGDNGRKRNSDWDGIWYVKTQITESGWQAEVAIPFKTLRFSNQDQQIWGVNFQRRIRRTNESAQWSLVPRPYAPDRVSRAGRLEGLSGLRPGRNLYVKPYLTAPLIRRQGDDVDFVPDAGFDLKYGLGSQLTLDLTVNTEFSQVEADQQQINLTRFSLFFPEKREFFLENATIFEFGPGSRAGTLTNFRDLIPFFSRKIGLSGNGLVPILGGGRLSGRAGKYTLGLLSLQVDEFEDIPATNFSMVRVSRDIFGSSVLGGIFINKQLTHQDFNRTYGADANFTFFDFLNLSSFLLKTETPKIPGQDAAGRFGINWTDPLLSLEASYLSIQKNFNPEVGFVPRTEIRKAAGSFAVRPRPGDRIPSIREFEPSLNVEYITDQKNILTTRTVEGRFLVQFQKGAAIWFERKSNFERLTEPFQIRKDQVIPVGDYSFNRYTLSMSTDRSRTFGGSLKTAAGSFFDGDKNSYSLTGRFQRPQYLAEVSWSRDHLNLPSGNFDTDLVATRLNYSFNPRVFLNALIQYNSDLQEINTNIRFNFIYKPLSDVFWVYNERRASTGEVKERALILKVTYVFDL